MWVRIGVNTCSQWGSAGYREQNIYLYIDFGTIYAAIYKPRTSSGGEPWSSLVWNGSLVPTHTPTHPHLPTPPPPPLAQTLMTLLSDMSTSCDSKPVPILLLCWNWAKPLGGGSGVRDLSSCLLRNTLKSPTPCHFVHLPWQHSSRLFTIYHCLFRSTKHVTQP